MVYLILIVSLVITVIAHEAGHAICATLFKVKIEVFSIGFFKPYLHIKWKGIDWRITPWLIGGYVQIAGETENVSGGLLNISYWKKCTVVLAGVFVNLSIALICYWINYRNIFVGLYIDYKIIISFFINNYDFFDLFLIYQPNLILVQLSLINIFCFVVNLIPFPALDGGYLWLYLMKPIWKENYEKHLQLTTKIGFITINILQVILVIWMFLK